VVAEIILALPNNIYSKPVAASWQMQPQAKRHIGIMVYWHVQYMAQAWDRQTDRQTDGE